MGFQDQVDTACKQHVKAIRQGDVPTALDYLNQLNQLAATKGNGDLVGRWLQTYNDTRGKA